jgi:hypothetical protein
MKSAIEKAKGVHPIPGRQSKPFYIWIGSYTFKHGYA